MPAFKSHSAASRIPVELIDKIVMDAGQEDLGSFSLISPRWADPCQRHLFRDIHIDPDVCHPLYDQGRHLWKYIRSLRFSSKRGRPPTKGNHIDFPAFLCELSRIESLVIYRLHWNGFSTAAFDGLLKIFGQPTFRNLEIFSSDSDQGFPLMLLRHCPSLRTLCFHHPDPSGVQVSPSLGRPPGLSAILPKKCPLQPEVLVLEGGWTIGTFAKILGGEMAEEVDVEGCEEFKGGQDRIEQTTEAATVGEELLGLVQLNRLSTLCLSYTDQDSGPGENVVHSLLGFCGPAVVDLSLRFERIDETDMGYGITTSATKTLANLSYLKMFYSCPDAEDFTLAPAKEWFFQFLFDLPSPKKLKSLDIGWVIYHHSSRKHADRHMLRQFDNFLKILGKLIRTRLTGLRYLKFESRTIWDDHGDGIYLPCQELPEYEKLVRRLRSSLGDVKATIILC